MILIVFISVNFATANVVKLLRNPRSFSETDLIMLIIIKHISSN
jgi:hypothetical protein